MSPEASLVKLSEPEVAKRYPRLTAYLSALPAGLASYPECQGKTSLSITLLAGLPGPTPNPAEVPEPLARYIARTPTAMWTPEAEARALALSIADHFEMSDAEYLQWVKAQNRSYFGSLMYRAVMAFASPTAIIPKAAARWAAVHRGSVLSVREVGPGEASVTLTFPPYLFAGLALQQVSAVVEAVLEHAHAKDASVALVDVSPTSGVYRVRWTP